MLLVMLLAQLWVFFELLPCFQEGLVFASYLHARITKSWQGEKPAMIASVGFVVVWICYLGVNFLGKGLHTYGQIL